MDKNVIKISENIKLKQSYQEIYQIIRAHCALNAYEICEKVNTGRTKHISQTTIYRAINHLSELNLVKPININDGHTRYESVEKSHHHHHFICLECKELYPIQECPFEFIEKNLPEQFEVKFHNFEVFGICEKCQNN